jgi:putative redox protein
MSVHIDLSYEGELRCSAVHGPSGDRLRTDAPKDNEGQERHFSPTDLVATALGSCILTIMGIAARKRGFSLEGARASVDKDMATSPRRHISQLTVKFSLPIELDDKARTLLEAVAETCPVAASLHPDTRIVLRYEYVAL